MTAKILLLKFESKTCPNCLSLNRRGTVETVRGEFQQLEVVTIMLPSDDTDMEQPKLSAAYDLSEDLGVQSLPTLIFQDEQGNELGRLAGAPNMTQLRKAVEECVERLGERSENAAKLAAYLTMA
jgi:thioredoxin-related protein